MTSNFPYHCSIRKILSDNAVDFDRIHTIDRDPHVLRWMVGDSISDQELLDFIKDKPDYFIYGISGLQGYVEQSEIGQLQGWVTLRQTAPQQLKMLSQSHLLPFLLNQNDIWEISYAKYPLAKSGQISDGVILTISDFLSHYCADHSTPSIIAFIDPQNVASENIVKNNHFSLIGQAFYDSAAPFQDDVWIAKLL